MTQQPHQSGLTQAGLSGTASKSAVDSALPLFTEADLAEAAAIVYRHMPPTPQYNWPLLSKRLGCQVWVKHENHTPTGSFKIRGGLVYHHYLRQEEPELKTTMASTRGNHGQSVALAGKLYGFKPTIVVPYGNSPDKNRSMIGWGAELIKYGHDFEESLAFAKQHAGECHMHFVPSFHLRLVLGVASYCMEFLKAVPDLETVYVPIGKGSGICAMIAARNALNHRAEIVGVVSTEAQAYKLSFDQGQLVSTDSANTIADGVACRIPNPVAFEWIHQSVSRIVAVPDDLVLRAIGALYSDTHHLAEGAGAIALAALMTDEEHQRMQGRRVGVVLAATWTGR
ncbi:MAG: threonine dehydratase [Vampirovibrionales bacterium]